ncbi:GYP7 [[Candida] subhashii]|uniref:GYP7 n=1 Tax=[Candida] subhashii TaxID=561895 RepID=A0A8J5UM68_9ASCO|nr:GYP7 [[Candida] subhashii]KAG7662927.1 GYP7 [[Candida] subhashii]
MSTTTSNKSSGSKGRRRTILSGEVELLFVKSKVYLHPTPSKRDNIGGYLSLSRPSNATNLDILLSFTPEAQLSTQEKKIYDEVDIEDIELDLDSLKLSHSKFGKATSSRIVSKPSSSTLSGYSFSVALSYIYSIQFRIPSHGYWFGSIVINTQDGEKLPIVFFHDDESPSTIKTNKLNNQRFDPFGDTGELYWGGIDFRKALETFVNVQRSTIETSVYLINPESNDLRNFAPFKTKEDINKKKQQQQQQSLELPFKLPDVSKFLTTAKWKVLETVATFSAKTKNQVLDIIEDTVPTPLKGIMYIPEVKRIGDDFDSARVYLAKWAQQVKEEAEASQSKYMLDDDLYQRINRELKSSEMLTQEEVSHTSRRQEINKQEWESFFDFSGRLCITVDEVKNRIFHGGLEPSIRKEAWLFLLGVYPWDSSTEERDALRNSYETSYGEYKLKWVNDEDKRATEFWQDQKHRIEKDINRTDRSLEIFKNPKKKKTTPTTEGAEDTADNNKPSRESSPETPDEEDMDDEFDISNIRNPHLYAMREILLTYNEYNENLGYVQGMTDLLSPLYVTFQDEVITFWAFTKFMDRMERNFVRDQSGMKNQLTTLNKLLQFMLPNLYKHLEICQSIDLFFFFRMLLVWFKRELEWDQVLRLWEILWTDYYSSQFHLFFALSVLSDNERIIIQNLRQFDEVLKYMNDLSMKLHLGPLLIRSELLFLKFKRMLDIIDRDNSLKKIKADPYAADNATAGDGDGSTAVAGSSSARQPDGQAKGVIVVGNELRELLKKEIIIQKEVERPEGVGGG